MPRLERVTIAVFAGNHGVAARGVSAYPPAVTAQMVANFAAGGAAINQIAKAAAAELRVVPIELERPTRDFTEAAAMSVDEFLEAVDVGYRTVPDDCDLLAVGEMGIANTTTAAHAVRGPARRRRGALGRPRHRRRRRRAGAQARGDRDRAEFPSRHSRRSAGGGGSAGRPRARGDRRRRARRAAASHPGAARRFRGDISGAAAGASRCSARSIIAAPGTSRPKPAIAICCAN